MYTLYHLPGTCSLVTQITLRELGVNFSLINKNAVPDYTNINPVGTVPALKDGETIVTEGIAILLHLLEKHDNRFLPKTGEARTQTLMDMLFANATVHPAYGKLFFLNSAMEEGTEKTLAMEKAALTVSTLWEIVGNKLGNNDFLDGDKVKLADYMLAVYSRWGQYFPVEIHMPEKVKHYLERVIHLPHFQASLQAEKSQAA